MGTRFSYQPSSRQTSDAEVLADVRRIAATLEPPVSYLSGRAYRARGGRFSMTMLFGRFGSWNGTLLRAGLRVGHRHRIADEEFFQRLATLWRRLGRQPTRAELDQARIGISAPAYVRRFGTWGAALRAFVDWQNALDGRKPNAATSPPHPRAQPLQAARPTPRYPSAGLRHRILKRDRFRCIHCGRSPAMNAGVVLHVDHIVPWCKGGETVMENLQTLCERCNRGKAEDPP
jgi:5-methylcytosine-specific restriction endonuclease McrA